MELKQISIVGNTPFDGNAVGRGLDVGVKGGNNLNRTPFVTTHSLPTVTRLARHIKVSDEVVFVWCER